MIVVIHHSTGVSRKTIQRGMTELSHERYSGLVWTSGSGRKKTEITDPKLADALESFIGPDTRGEPESVLRSTTKSARRRRETLPLPWLQLPKKPQEDGETPALGPGRPVPAHNTLASELLTSGDPVSRSGPARSGRTCSLSRRTADG